MGLTGLLIYISLDWIKLYARYTGVGRSLFEIRGIQGYTLFQSPRGWPSFSFEYPRNWEINTAAREADIPGKGMTKYWVMCAFGPRNPSDTRSAGLWVTAYALGNQGDSYASLEWYIERERSFIKEDIELSKDFEYEQLYREGTVPLDGHIARTFEYSHVVPGGLHGGPKVTVRGSIILALHGTHVYELEYGAAGEDYDHYLEAFERMVRTFRFLD